MQATICKLKYENLLNLIATNALSASRLWKRIMRHYCYMQIYDKKKSNIGVFNFMSVDDEDLFIDFKLDLYTDRPGNKDRALFDLCAQARQPEERNRNNDHKGREHETMPYFLTKQFSQIL